MDEMVEVLIGAESNVLRRFTDANNGQAESGASVVNERLCVSLLFAPDAVSGAKRDSLDLQCGDEEGFGMWVAVMYGLLALHADAQTTPNTAATADAERQARREAAIARAAPDLHRAMAEREQAAMEALKAEAEAEAERQYTRLPLLPTSYFLCILPLTCHVAGTRRHGHERRRLTGPHGRSRSGPTRKHRHGRS